MARYTLPIGDELHARLIAEAQADERSLGDTMRRLMREALDERDRRRREGLGAIAAHTMLSQAAQPKD
jgi:hypothetical protein